MVITNTKNRYFYDCNCEELKNRPFIIQIATIFNESSSTQMTKNEIIKKGQETYKKWPKDKATIFRALKTMAKCKILTEEKRGKGQSTLWSLNKNQLNEKDYLIHEIKLLDDIVHTLPHWIFDSTYFTDDLKTAVRQIRAIHISLGKQNLAANWALLKYKLDLIFSSKKYILLDKQLSLIFIFCLCTPTWSYLSTWFEPTKNSYRIKAEISLFNIFINHFYPHMTKEDISKKIAHHELPTDLAKQLIILKDLMYQIRQIDNEYWSKSLTINQRKVIDTKPKDNNESITPELIELYNEWKQLDHPILNAVKIPQYKPHEIDLFLEEYKSLLNPS